MPGLRNSLGSLKGADSSRVSALQRSTSSSRSRVPAAVRLAVKKPHNTVDALYDVSGVPTCSTSGRDIIMAKSALHALESLKAPLPQISYGWPPTLKLDSLNHSIKMAATWQDIQKLLGDASTATATASNASYALFRLGCMSCLAAPQKQAQIKASGLIERLLALTFRQLADCQPTELTHVMDACARLRYRPASYILHAISLQAQTQAPSFSAQQLPLLFWGFATIGYKPADATQQALNQAVFGKAAAFSPQGVSLTLWACASLHHVPSEAVLQALCLNWTKNMHKFKPHELANCLESCAALSYDPGCTLLNSIAQRMGRSQNASGQGTMGGKPSLTPGAKRIIIPVSPSAGRLSGLIKTSAASLSSSSSSL
ncbi:hypothetical protein ABBQ32_009674 [Trebouxia sp. C0010 RCD-2024]